MKLDINPTRMELLKLKKRVVISKRGHKLLKDKVDEFVKELLILTKELKTLREEFEQKLFEIKGYFKIASSVPFPQALISALSVSENKITINTTYKQLLNVKIPKFEILTHQNFFFYGFSQTSPILDLAIENFDKLLPKIIKIAEKEKSIEIIAEEIEKTRRRVNTLEYIIIPNIEETIKYIKMRLDENERDNQTQLMRIKEIIKTNNN